MNAPLLHLVVAVWVALGAFAWAVAPSGGREQRPDSPVQPLPRAS
jgi:hypothetical protein